MAFDHKTAQTELDILPAIKHRWSPRAYQDKEVPASALQQIMEAGRWAASSTNEQPWRILLASRHTHPAEWEKLFGCMVEWNQNWAKVAPVLGVICGKIHFPSGKENRHSMYDCGQFMAFAALEATQLGLQLHQMGGFSREPVRAGFGVPEEYMPYTFFAIGYPGDPAMLEDEYREDELKPRSRRPLSELIFTEGWEKPAF